MEDKIHFIEPLFERAEAYGKTSLELFKFRASNKIADVVSTFVSRAAVVIVFSMFIVFANIGVALWLGGLLSKSYYGFFFVAAFYGVIGSILYFFMRNCIKKRVSNSIISELLN